METMVGGEEEEEAIVDLIIIAGLQMLLVLLTCTLVHTVNTSSGFVLEMHRYKQRNRNVLNSLHCLINLIFIIPPAIKHLTSFPPPQFTDEVIKYMHKGFCVFCPASRPGDKSAV
jgi:hypothetical protein